MPRRIHLSLADRRGLYAVRRYLDLDRRKKVGVTIPLTTFYQDPLVARNDPTLAFDKKSFVEWEPGLTDGPTSARFAVVDYNADTEKLVPPARWDDDGARFLGEDGTPLDAEQSASLQFHQVNVWAIVQRALRFFEEPQGLGRSIPWGFEGNRLIIVPHAGYGQNAYYDRSSKSLQFYYFDAEQEEEDGGAEAKPRQRVYTSLSTDIIHHEFGHAILDGIRPLLIESSSVETAAFHESFGDLTAILTALRINSFRHALADRTRGKLQDANYLTAIAQEFGKMVFDKPYLRSARNQETMQTVAGSRSPHKVSQVLTGAMFDVMIELAKIYVERGRSPRQAFNFVRDRMQRTALQPLDLLPPFDVTFADYARAVLRADELADPCDSSRFREKMRNVFVRRGILTQEEADGLRDAEPVSRPVVDVYHPVHRIASSRAAAYRFLDDNRQKLGIPKNHDVIVADLYTAEKLDAAAVRQPRQIVLQYMWREEVALEGKEFGGWSGRAAEVPCGGTLVFDENGNRLSWVRKDGGQTDEGQARRARIRGDIAARFAAGQVGDGYGSPRGFLGAYVPPFLVRDSGGALRFEISSHVHLSEDDDNDREEGERRWEISS